MKRYAIDAVAATGALASLAGWLPAAAAAVSAAWFGFKIAETLAGRPILRRD